MLSGDINLIVARFVNSSHGLKAGASLLLLRFYAVIALWLRGTFCGNFRFPFHRPKLTSD